MAKIKPCRYEKKPSGLSAPRILFVEGPDDCFFFEKLLDEKNKSHDEINIISLSGKNKLRDILKAFENAKNLPEIKAYAVVLDADENCDNSVKDLEKELKDFGENIPQVGKFMKSKKFKDARIGTYLFPGDKKDGVLETLLWNLMEKNQQKCVKDYLSCAGFSHAGSIGDKYKRKIQIYLASQQDLCRGGGQGFRESYFDSTHHVLKGINNFLDEMLK